jgi:hypothetical protein
MLADQADDVEKHVRKMGEYLEKFAAFVCDNPNEFVMAVAAVLIAIFAAVLSCATIRLWRSTKNLWRASERQFVASNRPKLIVRQVVPKFQGHSAQSINTSGFLSVANVGGSDAWITESDAKILRTDLPLHQSGLFSEERRPDNFATGSIAPGGTLRVEFSSRIWRPDSATGMFESIDNGAASETSLPTTLRDPTNVYLIGWIRYRDKNGTERATGFCRIYRASDGRWMRVHDPDHEYED